MKFTKLRIENFLAITEADINLADRGLVLIQGINHDDSSADSNGAGKSSIADALCWALYGTTARDVTGDDVINDKAGKGTLVQVDIEDGDDVWRIKRHRKHPKGKNSLVVLHLLKDGTINDLTKGTEKLTQPLVDKIVGASHDVFTSAVYAGQERMPDLPAMTDKNIKILVEEAAGVTLLEEAYKEARERVGTAKAACDTINNTINGFRAKKDWIADQIVTTTAARDVWILDRQNSMATTRAEISPLIATVKSLDAQIAAIDEAAIVRRIADCDAKITAVYDDNLELTALNRELTMAETRQHNVAAEITRQKATYDRAKQELAGVQHKIGCPCDECGRPLTESEMAAATAAAQKKIDDCTTALRASKSTYEAAKAAAGVALQKRDAFAASMTDISQTSAERASAQSALDQLHATIRTRETQAARAKALGENLKKLSTAVNPHLAQLEELSTKDKGIQAEIDELAGKLREAEGVVAVAESVSRVFSPAGVRAHILDEVTPYLNQQTAKYLAIMSDGNIEANWTTLVKTGKGELREKFSIDVTNTNGGKIFKGQSGGEKRKVRISTALALQDLVATRATKPIELFIGDEIDDALDPAGLERLTQILEEKAQERGSVFIVSHNNLRDWVSQIITVEKKDDKTIVTETTT
ncbi:AAA family ATPase [Mesorhizobium sp. M0955]|uniref:AAA family ATPase n=1 Tax=Mesorhizobium sp. M0955 TaxID=2957033 RepID=UPI00333BB85A